MTTSKRYETICAMLRDYDMSTNGNTADQVISNPWHWQNIQTIPFYSSAAAMLIDCLKEMDSKASSRSAIAAIKRIVKHVPDHRPAFSGVFKRGDINVVCDGFRLIRFSSDISSLPHVENDFDVDGVFRGVNMSGNVLPLPSVAELKAHIAAQKVKYGAKNYDYLLYFWADSVYVNAQYLIDMIQALPGCGDDGILLPVLPPETKKEVA